jgi:hypothetical protein
VVWIAAGTLQLAAIVNDNRRFSAGDALRFAIDAQRVSLFDRGSEARLEEKPQIHQQIDQTLTRRA